MLVELASYPLDEAGTDDSSTFKNGPSWVTSWAVLVSGLEAFKTVGTTAKFHLDIR